MTNPTTLTDRLGFLIAVTRKQIVVVALIVLVASSLSALVAYRRAIRQSGLHDGAPGVVRAGGSGGCLDFHDAGSHTGETGCVSGRVLRAFVSRGGNVRSEEHTSELQSPCNLVCRLLLEKKKQTARQSPRQRGFRR